MLPVRNFEGEDHSLDANRIQHSQPYQYESLDTSQQTIRLIIVPQTCLLRVDSDVS